MGMRSNRTSCAEAQGQPQPENADIVSAKRLFARGEFIKSLGYLDKLNQGKARSPRPYLRALVRELVGDFTGSFGDLKHESRSPEHAIARARVLAKLGYVDKAVQLIRGTLLRLNPRERRRYASASVGIGGRRFDLELLGFASGGFALGERDKEWETGCVIEHLMALGDFDGCRRAALALGAADYKLLSFLDEVGSADKLSHAASRLSRTRVNRSIGGIRGWFSADEAAVLSGIAAETPSEENIVEVGSFAGRSTCSLALGARLGSQPAIHSVDPHSGLQGIFEGSTFELSKESLRSKGFEGAVTMHISTSVKTAAEWTGRNVGLLFIDGNHSYESVRKDFEGWIPHLAERGFLAFHDSNQPGPARLLREIIRENAGLRPVGLRDSLFVFQRTKDTPRSSHERPKGPWQRYLTTLSRDYSSWLRSEKRRMTQAAMDIFDALLQAAG
jgi:MMP 1-O-methyltransferase